MSGPGLSAAEEYRSRRRRRRLVRASTAVLALCAGAGGTWLAVSAPVIPGVAHDQRVAQALWAAAGLAALLLRWNAFGGRDVERWRRGADGEALTASMLERLPARHWRVRHDLRVPGSRANIDHVVIGRTGVWVVDTKTTKAPVRAGWRSVRFGSRRLDTTSLQWESETVADRLEAVLGRPVAEWVRPLVSVHGDGLRRRGGRAGGVRVVPAERLVRRIRRGRRRLARADVTAVADALDAAFPPGGSNRAGSRSSRPGSRDPGRSARMTAVGSDRARTSNG